jgi:hypothetical protein
MKRNMGKTDKTARLIAAGIGALFLAFRTVTGPLAVILAVIIVMLVVTSVVGFCPLYVPFGISTCASKKQ